MNERRHPAARALSHILFSAALIPGSVAGQAGSAENTPGWIAVDASARRVTLDITAGMTADNGWNFNGLAKGSATLTVPVGFQVVVNFRNDDPVTPHSLGIGELQEPFPPTFVDPMPVFEGAMTSNPTSVTESTLPGQSESLSFVADTPGAYALMCYVPAHALTGMWFRFVVSPDATDVSLTSS